MQAMQTTMGSLGQRRGAGYLAAVLGITAMIAVCATFHNQLSNTTVALALVLVVLFMATLWGRGPGIVASVLGMLCFNFFLPPFYTFTIADPENWITLAAFFTTASSAGHLSVTVKRRAAEAAAGRQAARLASLYNGGLLENSLDPLVTIGPDGKITDVNAATEIVTGRIREELIGTDSQTISPSQRRPRQAIRRWHFSRTTGCRWRKKSFLRPISASRSRPLAWKRRAPVI